jgi:hypothetical protein
MIIIKKINREKKYLINYEKIFFIKIKVIYNLEQFFVILKY